MTKNAMIGILVIAIVILVAAFLMRGPSEPVAPAPGPGNAPPAGTTDPAPPATAPNQ